MRKGTTASTSKLAKLRAERGLGLRELAELSGVGIRQIQGIEGGTSKVENTSLKNAIALADALGVHLFPAAVCYCPEPISQSAETAKILVRARSS